MEPRATLPISGKKSPLNFFRRDGLPTDGIAFLELLLPTVPPDCSVRDLEVRNRRYHSFGAIIAKFATRNSAATP